MSDDRALLEDAARAYWGDEIDDVCSIEWDEDDQCIAFTHADNQDHNGNDVAWLWDPLNDDANAFRLAVKLQMDVWVGPDGATVNAVECENSEAGDPCAAARRAITRAAAAIGRQMREAGNG